jgi:hypothetical protein
MLTKAGYRPAAIFGLWSTVLVAGVVAAVAGKALIGSSDALAAIFAQALAGGAVLALVAHAMISRRSGRRRLTGGAPDGCRLSVCALSSVI